ncbi:hypothetical protein QTP88_027371 [Uroleucon formosanum]
MSTNNKPSGVCTVPPIKIIKNKVVNNINTDNNSQSQSAANKRSLPSSPTTPTNTTNSAATNATKKSRFFVSPNRYSVLADNETYSTNSNDNNQVEVDTQSQGSVHSTTHTQKILDLPPPIFVKGVKNFFELSKELAAITGPDSFSCKSTSSHLKLQLDTPDNYRKIIHFLKDNNAEYHTYQLKSDKAFRVVLRNLHPSTPVSEISAAIEEIGHSVRQVTNIIHHQTKIPLPLFFVDLEIDENNSDIFDVTSILYTKIKVVEPHKQRQIPQCLNCQSYGCTVYKELQQRRRHPVSSNHARLQHPQQPQHPPADQSNYQPANQETSHTTNKPSTRSYANVTVGGDLNAKHIQWGCRASNPRGNSLLQTAYHSNISILAPPNCTYWPTSRHKKPDILDISVAKIPNSLHTQTQNLLDPFSDHSPVLLSVNCQPPDKINSSMLSQYRTDWEKFGHTLSEKTDLKLCLKKPSDIDDAVNLLTNNIQSAVWESAIQPPPRKTEFKLPIHIRTLISLKRRARAIWQHSRYPSDKRHYNTLALKLKRLLASHKSEAYANYASSLSHNDGSLWKASRKLLRTHNPPPTLRNDDDTWALSDQDKSNIFMNHLENTFQPHYNILSPSKIQEVESSLNSPLQMSPPPRAFSPGEVHFNIKKLSGKKSPGFDLITAEVIKNLPKKSILFLTQIFNAMLRLSYFPILWKYSTIILILKPKKPPDSPASYRPISLLPILSKLFEKLLLKRILPIVDTANILPNSQFGFRNSHSTVHQVHRLVDKISYALEEKLYCTGAFLDVSQAFDRVWHTGLLYKLKILLPSHYYLILKSYLEDRHFSVRVGSTFSAPTLINAGVPQGAVTAPILFNIYISDQPSSLHTLVGDFADDKAILASSSDPHLASSYIQDHLHLLQAWYKEWGVKMNESKSIHCTFTLRQGVCPTLLLNNQPLPTAQCVRYLGVNIDRRLTWSAHIKNKTRVLNNRFRLLRPFLTSKNIKLPTKLLLYKLLLRPIWSYGLQLWGSAKVSNTNCIQRFQNKFFASSLKLPSMSQTIPFIPTSIYPPSLN